MKENKFLHSKSQEKQDLIKGKRHLEIYEKYYLADIAFRHALLGFKFDDINDYLENIVFIELLSRGY